MRFTSQTCLLLRIDLHPTWRQVRISWMPTSLCRCYSIQICIPFCSRKCQQTILHLNSRLVYRIERSHLSTNRFFSSQFSLSLLLFNRLKLQQTEVISDWRLIFKFNHSCWMRLLKPHHREQLHICDAMPKIKTLCNEMQRNRVKWMMQHNALAAGEFHWVSPQNNSPKRYFVRVSTKYDKRYECFTYWFIFSKIVIHICVVNSCADSKFIHVKLKLIEARKIAEQWISEGQIPPGWYYE